MLEKENKKIVLASTSPRRKEVLELLGMGFMVEKPTDCREVRLANPERTVVENSIRKARNVSANLGTGNNYFIAGFDTIVYMGGKYFGKPKDRAEARHFVTGFSGKTHDVISGVCVLDSVTGKYYADFERTEVEFRELDEDLINSYLDKEYVFDKAGGYNIGGLGSVLVKRINGCFYNVVGLPLAKFISLLEKVNYKIL
ncbi:MAG: Maf family protein [Actinomycetota bacterium]